MGLMALRSHFLLQFSAGLIVVLVPGCCWACSAFAVSNRGGPWEAVQGTQALASLVMHVTLLS